MFLGLGFHTYQNLCFDCVYFYVTILQRVVLISVEFIFSTSFSINSIILYVYLKVIIFSLCILILHPASSHNLLTILNIYMFKNCSSIHSQLTHLLIFASFLSLQLLFLHVVHTKLIKFIWLSNSSNNCSIYTF